jgi:hypothetical protein
MHTRKNSKMSPNMDPAPDTDRKLLVIDNPDVKT